MGNSSGSRAINIYSPGSDKLSEVQSPLHVNQAAELSEPFYRRSTSKYKTDTAFRIDENTSVNVFLVADSWQKRKNKIF